MVLADWGILVKLRCWTLGETTFVKFTETTMIQIMPKFLLVRRSNCSLLYFVCLTTFGTHRTRASDRLSHIKQLSANIVSCCNLALSDVSGHFSGNLVSFIQSRHLKLTLFLSASVQVCGKEVLPSVNTSRVLPRLKWLDCHITVPLLLDMLQCINHHPAY